jgi:hypothetical protein
MQMQTSEHNLPAVYEEHLVPFYGDEIVSIRDENGEVWVPLKRLCENLGIDVDGQRRKIQDDLKFNHGVISVVANDGKLRDMFCLHLQDIHGWLVSINAKRVDPSKRGSLLLYQKECFKVLNNYWTAGEAINPRPSTQPKWAQELNSNIVQMMKLLREGFDAHVMVLIRHLIDEVKGLRTDMLLPPPEIGREIEELKSSLPALIEQGMLAGLQKMRISDPVLVPPPITKTTHSQEYLWNFCAKVKMAYRNPTDRLTQFYKKWEGKTPDYPILESALGVSKSTHYFFRTIINSGITHVIKELLSGKLRAAPAYNKVVAYRKQLQARAEKRDQIITLTGVTVLYDSGKALKYSKSNGEIDWVPKSCINAESEVKHLGDHGTLLVDNKPWLKIKTQT